MRKLYIPGPDNDSSNLDSSLKLSLILVALVLVGGSLFWFGIRPMLEPSDQDIRLEQEQALLHARLQRVESFANKSDLQLSEYQWTEDDLTLVFEYAPNEVTEPACDYLLKKSPDNPFNEHIEQRLIERVNTRALQAPWACLTRVYFANSLPDNSGLHQALENIWRGLSEFNYGEEFVVPMLDTFRRTRHRPDSERFYMWLRGCALRNNYNANTKCLELLRQITPMQGEDILMMIDNHLQIVGLRIEEYEAIVTALGEFARYGQPDAWKIYETRALADYDVDFRQAVIFTLCRFVHGSNDYIAVAAANELSRTAHFGARSADDLLLTRWGNACQLAFEGADGLFQPPAEESDHDVIIPLTQLTKTEHCSIYPDKPLWYCGATRWNSLGKPLRSALTDYYVRTRPVQWH